MCSAFGSHFVARGGPSSADSAMRRPVRRGFCDHDVMDAIDRSLLRLLHADARATYHDLGKAVRLSANTVSERVRRLRTSGVVRGYRAQLDPAALGRQLVMVTDVRLSEGIDRHAFEGGLDAIPQVVAGSRLTGEYDFQLRVVCVDATEFEGVVDTLKRHHGVRECRSRLVLHDLALDESRLLDL